DRFFACVPAAAGKDGYLRGAPASPPANSRGIIDRQPAPGQTGAHAREHVAHSAAGHSRIAGRVVTDRFPTFADNRAAAFEQQRNWKLVAKISGNAGARQFADLRQPFHLAGVWREEPRTATTAQDVDLFREDIQAIGVHDHRLWGVLD